MYTNKMTSCTKLWGQAQHKSLFITTQTLGNSVQNFAINQHNKHIVIFHVQLQISQLSVPFSLSCSSFKWKGMDAKYATAIAASDG